MEIEHNGFFISIEIIEKPTTWIVIARFKKIADDADVDDIPPIQEEFNRTDGAFNRGLYMIEKAKDKIDEHPSRC